MSQIVTGTEPIWRFVHKHTGVALSTQTKALGLQRDGRLVCGVLYDGMNGVNAWMHVAIERGEPLTRRFVWYAFHYPFVELGLRRVTGWVEASNDEARRFDEHLGFELEARLSGAAGDGGDVLLYVMRRERCRWLRHHPSMAPSRRLEAQNGQEVE